MKRRKRGHRGDDDNGFAEWGGYMGAKKAKLQEQFINAANEQSTNSSNIFEGVAIFVNGYSVPSADELKLLMMKHGGMYHHYHKTGKTTHIIATNLPDTKVKQLKNMNVVKPDWVVDSIAAGKLLDYRQYLLYSHQSKTQPKLAFKNIPELENKPSTSFAIYKVVTDSACDVVKSGTTNEPHNEPENHSSVVEKETKSITDDKIVPSKSGSSHTIKTASEAGFLSEFYSNSRLHHISTMGAMFKQYVNDLRERNSGVFPGVEKLKEYKRNQVDYPSASLEKYKTIIMHIDMDCFFVSVGLRKRPDLRGQPVAVTHAKAGAENSGNRAGVNRKAEFELYKTKREDKFKGKIQPSEDVKPWSNWVDAIDKSNSMSEIASCNYEARKCGLKNGMFLGQALKLCPNLKTIPYDFEGYKEVSYCLYNTVASYTLNIEAVSCDEMFVDCTSLLNSTKTSPLELATLIRAEIKDKTGCPCSAGFGANRLQARLATKRAKPDGQFYLEPAAVKAFMEDIKVSDIPGVGRSTSYKLASMGIKTCLDLQQMSLSKLQSEFGVKSGDSLYKHCRGEDTKKLVFGQQRKSVSAEVNYGIRFQNATETDTFLQELAREVHGRLQEVNMKTRSVTLKLMVRAKSAPTESAKFLGHGVCDHLTRSTPLQTAVADVESITREVMSISRQLNVEPTELRGIGIQLSRLESHKPSKASGNIIDKFLRPKSEITSEEAKSKCDTRETVKVKESKTASSSAIDNFFTVKKHIPKERNKSSGSLNQIKPTEIDKDVLESLPEDIRKEIMADYGISELEVESPLDSNTRPTGTGEPVYDCGLNYSQIDLEVLDELPLEIKREIQSSVNMRKKVPGEKISNKSESNGPRLDNSLSVAEVRALVKAWTASEDRPQPCDVTMMADYLRGLVQNRQLESLETCINCLHRSIERRQSDDWPDAYLTIVSSVQSTMRTVYGLNLRVPKTFKHFYTLLLQN